MIRLRFMCMIKRTVKTTERGKKKCDSLYRVVSYRDDRHEKKTHHLPVDSLINSLTRAKNCNFAAAERLIFVY